MKKGEDAMSVYNRIKKHGKSLTGILRLYQILLILTKFALFVMPGKMM
jgi:hypothetical protein